MLSDRLADSLSLLKNRASVSVDRAVDSLARVDDYAVDRFNRSFSSSISVWLSQHPAIAWAVSHPGTALIASLIVAVLTIRLIATIYRGVANTIDRMWLAILRSPVTLFKFAVGSKEHKTTGSDTIKTVVTNYEVTNDSEKLTLILTRLDAIEQQQQQIVRDLALLKQQPLTVEPQRLRLVEEAQQ